MEKACWTCHYKHEGAHEEPCRTCFASDVKYFKWQPAHTCSTCKHCDKKITEEPCLDCDIRVRNDKWEARE